MHGLEVESHHINKPFFLQKNAQYFDFSPFFYVIPPLNTYNLPYTLYSSFSPHLPFYPTLPNTTLHTFYPQKILTYPYASPSPSYLPNALTGFILKSGL